MTTTQKACSVNLPVGEDLNGKYAHALTIDSNGRAVMADAATEVIVGFLSEDPGRTTVAGADYVPVAIVGGGGVLNAVANAAITAGQIIIPTTTDGKVAGVANIGALVADQTACGIALESAAANQVFEILAMPVSGPHTA